MKHYHFAFLAAAVAILVAGCSKSQPKPEPEKTLKVTPSTLSFDAASSTKQVTVTTNDTWEATTSASWIELKTESKTVLQVKVKANEAAAGEAAAARNGEVVITTKGGKTEKVTVSQAAESIVFTVTAVGSTEFTSDGGALTVTVGHNVNYTVSCAADWIEEVTTKAVKTDSRDFNVKANTGEAREAEIIFTPATGEAKKVTVKQAKYVEPGTGIGDISEGEPYVW